MKNRRGFSLVEMSVMIAIGSIIFISLGRAVVSLVDSAIENRDYSIALNIAKWEMGIVTNAAYPAVVAETAQTADASFPSFIPTLEVVNISTVGAGSIREIRVRVRKNTVAGPVLIYLTTYRSDIITFGNGV